MLVGYEGEAPSGHYVVPNSIHMAALTVPVFAIGTSRDKPVAFASDLQRGEGRALTMDIKVAPEYVFLLDLKKYEARVELFNLETTPKPNNKLIIRKATLGSLALKRI